MSYQSFYDDDTAEHQWDDGPPKRRLAPFFLIGALLVVVLVAGGWIVVLAKGHDAKPVAEKPVAESTRYGVVQTPAATDAAVLPTTPPTTAAAPPTGTPTKQPTPVQTKKSLAPPPKEPLPPPPPKPVPTPGCKGTYKGTQLPMSQVHSYLDAASERQVWGSSRPAEEQAIRVPKTLLYAIAKQESGWQSNIYACDGGVGIMQVMPVTADWLNQRFGTSFKIETPQDNALLGGQYLAYAIQFFGVRLHTFDVLNNEDLLNAVISSYNNGIGAVNLDKGHDGITNWGYVGSVKGLLDDSY